jgi:transposase-like protein
VGKKEGTRGSDMSEQPLFKWRHFESEIILLCIRRYLRYSLSYWDLEEMMLERGLRVDHATIFRWVQRYSPSVGKALSPSSQALQGLLEGR